MENRYVISEALYLDWAKHPLQPKRAAGVIRALWLVLFAVCAVMMVQMARSGDYAFAALYALLLAFAAYRALIRPRVLLRRQFRQLLRLQKADKWERVVQLGGAVTVIDGSARVEFPYADLIEVREQPGFWALLFPESVTIRAKKDAWIRGGVPCPDADALALLREKAPGAKYPS